MVDENIPDAAGMPDPQPGTTLSSCFYRNGELVLNEAMIDRKAMIDPLTVSGNVLSSAPILLIGDHMELFWPNDD